MAVLSLGLALAGCGSSTTPGSVASDTPPSAQAADAPPEIPVMGPERPILALGDSLLAGYGVGADNSYPHRLELALRARGINARITNAGVSGDTTADGLARLDFTLKSMAQKPDLVLISLGGNDLLRGLPPEQAEANLGQILSKLQAQHIPAVLLGMKAPPNLGQDYTQRFDAIYPALARKYGATLIPFFLQPVYDTPALLQNDHIHPTAEGIDAMVAATVDQVAGALPKTDGAAATPVAGPSPH